MLALLLASLSLAATSQMESALQWRMKIVEMSQSSEKEARSIGALENFLQEPFETSLAVMESRGLHVGVIKKQPWSGHYWPNYSGGLGLRYADRRFPQTQNWGRAERYFRSQSRARNYFNILSPAEKYDHITGNNPHATGSLSNQQWSLGRDEFERTGSVATWQGICHGWAPASIYMSKPMHNVSFRFPEGELVLNTDDIKALGSLQWASARYDTLHVGFRCDTDNPRTNREGRVLDSKCFDVNPADWHMALAHMIGVKKESFIIDAEAASEVWNHPVVSYRFEFYDPTNVRVKSQRFRDVVADRTNNLPHRSFRSPGTKYVVGVISYVSIGTETMPGSNEDMNDDKVYTYDLELDGNYRIVGGEWRGKARPDFLWRVRPGSKPRTPADSISLNMWDMRSEAWKRASLINNPQGSPINLLVDELFRLSK